MINPIKIVTLASTFALLLPLPTLVAAKDCNAPQRHVEKFNGEFFSRGFLSREQQRPYKGLTKNGIDFVNFQKLKFSELTKRPSSQPLINTGDKKKNVAAIGGVIDRNGNSLNRSIAYMAPAPGKKTHRFDLKSFNFFCTDNSKTLTKCDIGVAMFQPFEDNKPAVIKSFTFDPQGKSVDVDLAHADLGKEGHNLRFASFGRAVALWADDNTAVDSYLDSTKLTDDPMTEEGWTSTDDEAVFQQAANVNMPVGDLGHEDLNARDLTVYVDNVAYNTYECNPKEGRHNMWGVISGVMHYPEVVTFFSPWF